MADFLEVKQQDALVASFEGRGVIEDITHVDRVLAWDEVA
jgi:hypothetical protein